MGNKAPFWLGRQCFLLLGSRVSFFLKNRTHSNGKTVLHYYLLLSYWEIRLP
jgi:hypothetical protein